MNLTTHRLIIRNWQPIHDAQPAFDIYGDPRVTAWLLSHADDSIQTTQGRLQRYCHRTKNGLGIWAVVDKSIDRAIGSILLIPLPNSDGTASGNIEIGWHFRPASWGYGYATEAAQAILDYGFEQQQLAAIYAITTPENKRSQQIMVRLRMQSLGLTKKYYSHPLLMYVIYR